MKIFSSILLLIAACFCTRLYAQHITITHYDHSKKVYERDEWNKSNAIAHFTLYYENGRIKAEGYMKRDRYHHYKMPYRAFRAYDSAGMQIQYVAMGKDSASVFTYDDRGILRDKINVQKHRCSETGFALNGKMNYRLDCYLPDSLSYFKDYYYPDKWVKKNYANACIRPLWPLGYGEAGNDGVSDPGTFKIYFEPDTQEPHSGSRGISTTFDSSGDVTKVVHLPPQ